MVVPIDVAEGRGLLRRELHLRRRNSSPVLPAGVKTSGFDRLVAAVEEIDVAHEVRSIRARMRHSE